MKRLTAILAAALVIVSLAAISFAEEAKPAEKQESAAGTETKPAAKKTKKEAKKAKPGAAKKEAPAKKKREAAGC